MCNNSKINHLPPPCSLSEERKTVSVFWTGGYDSTYRVVQLSRCPIYIQPIYLKDNRPSERNELNAIKEIKELLIANPQTKAEFLPLQIIDKSERLVNDDVSEAYKRVLAKDFVGSQYDWLGCFAAENPGIEMSIHRDDKAINVIQKYGKLKKISDNIIGDYYVVDKENSPKDIVCIWGNLHFPLAEETKIGMKEYYVNNGYSDVANKTWFCYTPINGKPCGKCNPCKYTIQEGLRERFTFMALLRYYIYTTPILLSAYKSMASLKQKILKIIH